MSILVAVALIIAASLDSDSCEEEATPTNVTEDVNAITGDT